MSSILVRVTEAELKTVNSDAARAGMTQASYVRAALGLARTRPRPERVLATRRRVALRPSCPCCESNTTDLVDPAANVFVCYPCGTRFDPSSI